MCKFKTNEGGCSLCTIKQGGAIFTPPCHAKTCATVQRSFRDALLDKLLEQGMQELPRLKMQYPIETILAGARDQGYTE